MSSSYDILCQVCKRNVYVYTYKKKDIHFKKKIKQNKTKKHPDKQTRERKNAHEH